MFGLIDCNNFYVSCERVFRPDLEDVPVIVMSNNDGCAIARSEEVKALGIKMGQPIHEIKHLVVQHNIRLLSPNFSLYGDLSNRVMSILAGIIPHTEVYSIDECFLDFTAVPKNDLATLAEHVRFEIKMQTGIPTSVGVACTKTLAKAANKYAKLKKLKSGVFVFYSEDGLNVQEIPEFLKEIKISDVWGVGRSFGKWLKGRSVNTAYEFCNMDSGVVHQKMKSVGMKTWYELHGKSCIEMHEGLEPKKSIATTRTFASPLSDIKKISQAVASYASACAEKLREQNCVCYVLTTFVTTNYHDKSIPYFSDAFSVTFADPTQYSPQIVQGALLALKKIFRPQYSYKRAGVVLSGIEGCDKFQMSISTDLNELAKEHDLMAAVDHINHKYGRNKIMLSVQNLNNGAFTRCEHKSPAYTTNWDEIPMVDV